MRFRTAIIWMIVAILLSVSAVHAQTKRILMVETMSVPVVTDHEKYFLKGLEKLGYHLGENVVVDEIKAQGDIDRARAELRRYLSQTRPDIVVSFATLASQATMDALAGTDIPHVFGVVSDPVGAGLIEEVGKPTGTNVTGLVYTLMRQSKIDMATDLFTQPFPERPVRVGIILASYPSAMSELEKLQALAKQDGRIEFKSYLVDYKPMPDGLEDMLADVRAGIARLSSDIDYWWIVPGPLGESWEFSELLLKSAIPVGLCHTSECTRNGGLFFVNPSYKEGGEQIAGIVDSILKGVSAGSIPPVPPDSFELGLNLNTAIEQNIVIPSELLELAGKNVWR